MQTFSISYTKKNFLEIIEYVEKGNEVIITKARKPVAKLIPYKDKFLSS